MVRQTDHGMSLAADYLGTILSYMDYFTMPQRTMRFNLTMHWTVTLYSLADD